MGYEEKLWWKEQPGWLWWQGAMGGNLIFFTSSHRNELTSRKRQGKRESRGTGVILIWASNAGVVALFLGVPRSARPVGLMVAGGRAARLQNRRIWAEKRWNYAETPRLALMFLFRPFSWLFGDLLSLRLVHRRRKGGGGPCVVTLMSLRTSTHI